jgi:hypothetical protein
MPPVDLPVVRARAAAIAEKFSDPPEALAAIHSLLEDYADRAHRTSRRLAARKPENLLKTPMPVVRAIVAALRQPAREAPQAALALIKGLWIAPSREERRIAAELLGIVAPLIPAEAITLIEQWQPSLAGGEMTDMLANVLAPLMQADPAAALQNIQQWVTHPRKWTRRFGLAALMVLAKDRHWDDVPAALDALRQVMRDPEPEVRHIAAEVLRQLISKSPVEVSLFLREQAVYSDHHTHWIVRTAMTKLPPEDQSEIIRVMRR